MRGMGQVHADPPAGTLQGCHFVELSIDGSSDRLRRFLRRAGQKGKSALTVAPNRIQCMVDLEAKSVT